MAARMRRALVPQRIYESLWTNCPPCFLAPALRHLSTSTPTAAETPRVTPALRRSQLDAYTRRQKQQRKDANRSLQAQNKEEALKRYGDPIRGGGETEFVRSFDGGIPDIPIQELNMEIDLAPVIDNPGVVPPLPRNESEEAGLGHGINHAELQKAFRASSDITEPFPPPQGATKDQVKEAARNQQNWEMRTKTATEAVQRIVGLVNSSSRLRSRKNVERIVSTLGRHNTDATLKPKARSAGSNPNPVATPRAGPDTGSSEVQIGILTAKIRVLDKRYRSDGRRDKVNKRNLRLLLHRRQKLLQYMERRERGSARWTNMLELLGLTPGTWRGEISVE